MRAAHSVASSHASKVSEFWTRRSFATLPSVSFGLSIAAHVVVLVLAVRRPTTDFSGPNQPAIEFARYLLPPPPKPSRHIGPESIEFVELMSPGVPSAIAKYGAPGVPKSNWPRIDRKMGSGALEPRPDVERPAPSTEDQSVFTSIEVDSVAMRDPMSVAPDYPAVLLMHGVEGSTLVQFVVDTSGLVDTTSFLIVSASHREFAAAVRTALPRMKFRPGKIGDAKVRQYVQVPFTFMIESPGLQVHRPNP